MSACCVTGCKNRQKKNSNISFHRFPQNEVKRELWIKALRRENWIPTKHSKICSVHFEEELFDRSMSRVLLKEHAVPTLFSAFPSQLEKAIYEPESIVKTEMKQEISYDTFTSDTSVLSDVADERIHTRNHIKEEQTMVPGNLKVYPIRLHPDMEIKSTLQQLVMTNNLKAAFILTCCGSIKKATLRFATDEDLQEKTQTLDECFEITSLVGTVCNDGAHLHVTLGRYDGSTVSGHVLGDLIVQTTAEIILGEISGAIFERKFDKNTGWPELHISRDSKE